MHDEALRRMRVERQREETDFGTRCFEQRSGEFRSDMPVCADCYLEAN